MAEAPDYESTLIRQACKSGLTGMSVELEWRGQKTRVSDKHFDLASGPPPANLPPEDQAPVQAAIGISALKPGQVSQIYKLHKTDEKASKAYQGIVLFGLCAKRREARALMTRALSGDKKARALAQRFYQVALGKLPAPDVKSRRRAHVFACLCNQVMAELVELGSKAPAEGQEPEKVPEQATQASDMTSAAISFDEQGNPRINQVTQTPEAPPEPDVSVQAQVQESP